MTSCSNYSKTEQDHLRSAIALVLGIYAMGLLFSFLVWRSGMTSFELYGNSFHILFVRNEPAVFLLLFLTLLLIRGYLLGNRLLPSWPVQGNADWLAKFPWLWVIPIAVVILAWLGDLLVLHSFPLSNDEFLPRFQAQIFLAGKIKTVLPQELQEFGKALTPYFTIFNPQAGTWISAYLPGYAALRTVFLALGVESLTNPALAGLSLVIIGALAKKLWPQEPLAPFLAVILLASSSQFLITSMTSYTYPAHLCFNLAWLYGYCRGDRLGYLVTPWIGFFALGLHNPFIHALFVTPFLLAILWNKKWKILIYFGLIYAGACILWYSWWNQVVMLSDNDLDAFRIPGAYQLLIQPMNLSQLFSWQSLPLTVLGIVALLQWASLPSFLRNLAWGCFLTFGFFFFFYFDQVLGWGYRFFYGVLGNLVLLGVAGWFSLRETVGLRKTWGFVLLGTILAVLVQFPIRCLQVESFVRPFAKSAQYLASLNSSFAIIDQRKVWGAQLLVRNDPFLRNHPRLLFATDLNEEQLTKLRSLGTVYVVQPEELAHFGLPPRPPRHVSP